MLLQHWWRLTCVAPITSAPSLSLSLFFFTSDVRVALRLLWPCVIGLLLLLGPTARSSRRPARAVCAMRSKHNRFMGFTWKGPEVGGKQNQPAFLQSLSFFRSFFFIFGHTSFTSERSFDCVENLNSNRFGTEVGTFTFFQIPFLQPVNCFFKFT